MNSGSVPPAPDNGTKPPLGEQLKSLNTHRVGIGGLLVSALGIFGPIVAVHVFHPSPDVVGGITAYGKILATTGLGLAYYGRPATVSD